MPRPEQNRSGRVATQAVPLAAATLDGETTARGLHALAETMRPLAAFVVWLIRALHRMLLRIGRRPTCRNEASDLPTVRDGVKQVKQETGNSPRATGNWGSPLIPWCEPGTRVADRTGHMGGTC